DPLGNSTPPPLLNGQRAVADLPLPEPRLVEPPLAQLERREPAAVDAAGVDPDLVRQVDEHRAARGVPEDDRLGQAVRGQDELLADPEEVLLVLLIPWTS